VCQKVKRKEVAEVKVLAGSVESYSKLSKGPAERESMFLKGFQTIKNVMAVMIYLGSIARGRYRPRYEAMMA
jgi:hypothetical protein